MTDTRRPVINKRQSRSARSKRWTNSAARIEPKKSQDARRNYEQYLALARAEAQIGNTIGAETYYQYAEHYFRSLSSDQERT
jgi:membrane-bound lytic murein transglycosylase B